MSPPLRQREHQAALWEALASGLVADGGPDHCPFNAADKKRFAGEDFTRIPNGCGGIEYRLPLLYTFGVRTGKIPAAPFRRPGLDAAGENIRTLPAQGHHPRRQRRRPRGLGPRKEMAGRRRGPMAALRPYGLRGARALRGAAPGLQPRRSGVRRRPGHGRGKPRHLSWPWSVAGERWPRRLTASCWPPAAPAGPGFLKWRRWLAASPCCSGDWRPWPLPATA